MIEEWKDVKGFEKLYEVSNLGEVRAKTRIVKFGTQARTIIPRNLHPFEKVNGYLSVKIYKDKKQYTCYVHRLVAMSFCSGFFDKADVNHIDGNKSNNKSSNLEWCTRSENVLHSVNVLHNQLGNRKIGKKWNSKPIVQLSLNGEKIKDWSSAFEVQRVLGFCEASIRNCLYGANSKGRRCYQSHGYKWMYAKDFYVDQILSGKD